MWGFYGVRIWGWDLGLLWGRNEGHENVGHKDVGHNHLGQGFKAWIWGTKMWGWDLELGCGAFMGKECQAQQFEEEK